MVWVGAGAILWAFFVRATTVGARVPWWDSDPTQGWVPEATLTPLDMLGLDALVWLAGSVVLGAGWLLGRRIPLAMVVLVLLGQVSVMLHGLVLEPAISKGASVRGDFFSLVRGSAWGSALFGAVALRSACADPALRRAIAATVLASVCLFVAKGAHQVFFEHPQVVERFRADPEGVLRAQGWEPGSSTAQIFERRLLQPDATGWFGFSNVYGSVLAALLPGVIGVCVAGFRRVRRAEAQSGEPGLVALVALGTMACLWLSASRGAWGAGLIGLAMFGVVLWRRRLPGSVLRRLPAIALAVPVGVLALVFVRGIVGERLAEVSIYFRWQYVSGAMRIIADHPAFGVGPDGFKDAYLLAKPPTSPEEVESPHSLVFDWLATLGVLSIAWVMVCWLWLESAARKLAHGPDEDPGDADSDPENGPTTLWVLGVIAATTLVSQMIGWQNEAPTERFLVPLGAFVWFVTALVCARIMSADRERLVSRAMACGAFGLAAHSMLEITPVLPGSAGLAMAMLAIASAPEERDASFRGPSRSLAILVAPIVVASLVVIAGVLPAMEWQARLQAGAVRAKPLGELRTAERGLVAQPDDPARMAAVESVLSRAARSLGAPEPTSREELDALLVSLASSSLEGAIEALAPPEPGPSTAAARTEVLLARLRLQASRGAWDAGDYAGAARHAREALAHAEAETELAPRSAGAWGRLASLHQALHPMTGDTEHLVLARDAWIRASVLDPHGLGPVTRLARLNAQLGDLRSGAHWARRALLISEAMRLDPLRQLPPETRAEMERIAASGVGRRP